MTFKESFLYHLGNFLGQKFRRWYWLKTGTSYWGVRGIQEISFTLRDYKKYMKKLERHYKDEN